MNRTGRMMRPILGLFVLLLLAVGLSFAGRPANDKTPKLQKTETPDFYTAFLINNVFNYYANNGDGSFNPHSTDAEGFEFPKGTGKHMIYEDGVVWGGFHKGVLKVGGSTYNHGLQAGQILTPGTATTDPVAADPNDAKYKTYRVRPDINPNTPFSAVEGLINATEIPYLARYPGEVNSAQTIYDNYISDWNNWPADEGAPFAYGKDANGVQRTSGPYDPAFDVPGQPGADQTLWYVANDLNDLLVNDLAGSLPMGLEFQRTIWGYARAGALSQIIFESSLIINKSGAPIDSMFFVQWSDPDLGDPTDDFVGCDTTHVNGVSRSLGFVYNGKPVDAVYGADVPAGGFDLLQGPIIPAAGRTAIFRQRHRSGFANLLMTSFSFFTGGADGFSDPPLGSGAAYWYRLMNGLISSSGAHFIDPNTNLATKFCLAGDPVKAQDGSAGWVDGQGSLLPSDRRMVMSTGPFELAPGDTQELVVANLVGLGADRISSISALRSVDDATQASYDVLFRLPLPPSQPIVSATALDGEIVLSWGDSAGIANTEGKVDQGFTFEGYNIYEFPGPSTTGAIPLGTYDLADGITTISDTAYDPNTTLNLIEAVQVGKDVGIIHSIDLKSSKVTAANLVNGNKYYFAVTAYSYNANPPATAGTHSLEDQPQIITVVPQSPNPGTRYKQKQGDVIPVTLTTAPGASLSDGTVQPVVIDPTRLTGDTYKVTFSVDTNSGNTLWGLADATKNASIISGQSNQTGDNNYPVVDGIEVKVLGPPPGMKADDVNTTDDTTKWGWKVPAGTRHWTWSGTGGTLEGFEGAMGAAPLDWGGTLGIDQLHNVLIKLAATDSAGNLVNASDTTGSYGYRFLRACQNPPADPSFAPFIIHGGSGTSSYDYQDYVKGVPLAAYDLESTPPMRLAVAFLENNVVGGSVDGKYWPPLVGSGNFATTSPREWLFIFASPYTGSTPNAAYETNLASAAGMPLMWLSVADRRSAAPYATGDEFEILANHVNTPAHTFTFTSVKPVTGDKTIAQDDVTKINVFPNPYMGFNPQETNKYARFVTFNHLPAKATVRIINLAGVLVRTLVKNDPGQFLQWDLNNGSGFPVAAGVYIAYIDMPDLGVTKTLKLAIIPEQQYLDHD